MKLISTLTALIFLSLRLFSQSGVLDSTFGVAGKAYTAFPVYDEIGMVSAAVDSSGKIIIAGWMYKFPGTQNLSTMVRYNADGSTDSTFGTAGVVPIDIPGSYDEVHDVAIQEDGKIVIVGAVGNPGDPGFMVTRYDNLGDLDTAFNGSGYNVTLEEGSYSNAVLLQHDGKIISGGTQFEQDFAIIRYNSDGTLDSSFGQAGIVITDIPYGDYQIEDMALQTDGKIIAGGTMFYDGSDPVIAIARYLSSGLLDSTFSEDGIVVISADTAALICHAIAIQQDGKIILAGRYNTQNQDLLLMRYLPDGTPDSAFGNGGMLIQDLALYETFRDVLIQPDGKILCGGDIDTGSPNAADFALFQYNSDGQLDSTFGVNGVAAADFFASGPDYGYQILAQPGGKLVLAGSVHDPDYVPFLGAVRFLNDIATGGIEVADANSGIHVYPNPASEEVIFRYELLRASFVTLL
jgi:uncharacterized delta-60 repeat protein